MKIAYYCPLKPLDHPKPSGDRQMAIQIGNLLMLAGHEVTLISRHRAFLKDGGTKAEAMRAREARAEVMRIAGDWQNNPDKVPDLWVTYHSYHKAPDEIGPELTAQFALPYMIVEASISQKQADGIWAGGYQASLAGFHAADVLLAMTEKDRRGFEDFPELTCKTRLFWPFLDVLPYQVQRPRNTTRPRLITVAMMREDVKRQSYLMLLSILEQVRERGLVFEWRVVGDGPAAELIRGEALARLGESACFLGALSPKDVQAHLIASDVYVWPGLAEAYGMAILEAQAAGLPVIAFDEGGISSVVDRGQSAILIDDRDEARFADALIDLIGDVGLHQRMSIAARANVLCRHSVDAAKNSLAGAVDAAMANHHG